MAVGCVERDAATVDLGLRRCAQRREVESIELIQERCVCGPSAPVLVDGFVEVTWDRAIPGQRAAERVDLLQRIDPSIVSWMASGALIRSYNPRGVD